MEMKDLEALLEKALASPLGLRVKTADSDALRRRLYVTLRKAKERGDLRFERFQLSPSPKYRQELYILKEPTKRKGRPKKPKLELDVKLEDL